MHRVCNRALCVKKPPGELADFSQTDSSAIRGTEGDARTHIQPIKHFLFAFHTGLISMLLSRSDNSNKEVYVGSDLHFSSHHYCTPSTRKWKKRTFKNYYFSCFCLLAFIAETEFLHLNNSSVRELHPNPLQRVTFILNGVHGSDVASWNPWERNRSTHQWINEDKLQMTHESPVLPLTYLSAKIPRLSEWSI